MLSLSGRVSRCFWFCLGLSSFSLPVAAVDLSNDSILRGMVDMLGLMRQMGSQMGSQMATAPNSAMPGWPSAFPNLNQMMPGGNGSSLWELGGGNTPAATLQGYWLGANGERLGFWQQFYLLQAAQGQTQGGRFGVRNERLLIFETGATVQPYEYAQQGDRLVLRDPYGRMFLYRRATGMPGAPSWGGF